MKVQRLIQCPVCKTQYYKEVTGGCPKCSGEKTGVVRSLSEETAPAKKTSLSFYNPASKNEQVYGFLVCVNGDIKGHFFRLASEKNILSTDKNCEVPLYFDEMVREGTSGLIIFDNVEDKFWLQNGPGGSVI